MLFNLASLGSFRYVLLKNHFHKVTDVEGMWIDYTATPGVVLDSKVSISQDGSNFTDPRPISELSAMWTSQGKPEQFDIRILITREGSESGSLMVNDITINLTDQDKLVTCRCSETPVDIFDSSFAGLQMDANLDIINPLLGSGKVCGPSMSPHIVANVYALEQQLNLHLNQRMGYEVDYFRTDPMRDTQDVIMKEYVLKNVVDRKCVKVVIPSGAIPEEDYEMNQWGIDFGTFEVHISPFYFKQQFGADARPMVDDFMWFATYQRFYQIFAVSEGRGAGGKMTFWKLQMRKYEKSAAVQMDSSLEDLLSGAAPGYDELVNGEYVNEMADANNDKFQDATQANDPYRLMVNEKVRVIDHKLIIASNQISAFKYSLSDVTPGGVAVTYKSPDTPLKSWTASFVAKIVAPSPTPLPVLSVSGSGNEVSFSLDSSAIALSFIAAGQAINVSGKSYPITSVVGSTIKVLVSDRPEYSALTNNTDPVLLQDHAEVLNLGDWTLALTDMDLLLYNDTDLFRVSYSRLDTSKHLFAMVSSSDITNQIKLEVFESDKDEVMAPGQFSFRSIGRKLYVVGNAMPQVVTPNLLGSNMDIRQVKITKRVIEPHEVQQFLKASVSAENSIMLISDLPQPLNRAETLDRNDVRL